mmetsp:Transcript_31237/g.70285  ORF Transcript_31237/g.70285 Transcript_31237/m.70285 type:complete len:176 (+) Transcript_31237:236-763(+)
MPKKAWQLKGKEESSTSPSITTASEHLSARSCSLSDYGSSQETKMKTKNWERNWDVISDSESESDVSTEITVSSKPKALALNTTVTPYLGTELSKHFDADNFDLHVYSLTCNAQNLVNNIWSSVDHVCKTVPFNGISPEPRHDYSDNVSAQAEVFRRRSTSHSSEHSSFTPSHLS